MHGAWIAEVFEPLPLSRLRSRVLPTENTTPLLLEMRALSEDHPHYKAQLLPAMGAFCLQAMITTQDHPSH